MLFEDEVLCAYEIGTSKIVTIGKESLQYVEDDNICVCNPLKWGAVADYIVFTQIIKYFTKKIQKSFIKIGNVAFCIPVKNLTAVELTAFTEAFQTSVKPEIWVIKKSLQELCENDTDQILKKASYFVEFESDYYFSEYYL